MFDKSNRLLSSFLIEIAIFRFVICLIFCFSFIIVRCQCVNWFVVTQLQRSNLNCFFIQFMNELWCCSHETFKTISWLIIQTIFKNSFFSWFFIINMIDAISYRTRLSLFDSEFSFIIIKSYEFFLNFVVVSNLSINCCDIKFFETFESIMTNTYFSFIKTFFLRLRAYLTEFFLWIVKLHFNDMLFIIEWKFFFVVAIFLNNNSIFFYLKNVFYTHFYNMSFNWALHVWIFSSILILIVMSIFEISYYLLFVEFVRFYHAWSSSKWNCVNSVDVWKLSSLIPVQSIREFFVHCR